MNITKIEKTDNPIIKGKFYSSPVYSATTRITLENGEKTTYCIHRRKLRDLKKILGKMPFQVTGAYIEEGIISISLYSNLI